MSRVLESMLVGRHKKELTRHVDQYEVENYVARKRKNLLVNQVKTVIIRPSVLAGIFGAGVAKEMLTSKQSGGNGKSGGVSKMQILSILSRFV